MKTHGYLSPLVILVALLLTGCAPEPDPAPVVPEGAQPGDLAGLKECEYQPAGTKTKYTAECGTLVVPENWEQGSSRLLALPVVRIPASVPGSGEPVFLLQGGPGQPNLTWEPPDWLLKSHDVVMVGYRGAEGSVVLECPESEPVYKAHTGRDVFSETARAESLRAVRQCAANLQKAGVDLSGYTMPGVIEDMEAARRALGYDRINLLSESYGTRLAQMYAYLHPSSLRRMVLIGVNTPGGFIWRPADFDRLIVYMSALCARDASCSSRTTNLAQTMYAVNHNMPRRWLFFNIDPDTVRIGTHTMFFRNSQMPLIIDAYLAAAEGDPSGLAMMNLFAKVMPAPQRLGDQFSKATSADLDKYSGIQSVSLENSIMGAPMSEVVWPLSAEWPIQLIRPDLRDFQESDVEMLLVNGTVDFSTPPAALDEARPYYHKAQIVLLPEFSHTGDVLTLQPEAFQRLVTSYFDTGVADDSLYVYQPLSFKPRMSLTMMAKLVVLVMVILPALVILGAVAGTRRFRRRRRINFKQSLVNQYGD